MLNMIKQCGAHKAGLVLATVAVVLLYAGLAAGQDVNTTELRAVQPLTGGWRFIQDDQLSDEAALDSNGQDWQTVSLPHTWNAKDAASLNATDYKRGIGWYRLEFNTPTVGASHWLEFGAASLVADVWLNGKKLGQHKGGFTAFRFDVTDALLADRPNALLVKVNNNDPKDDNDVTAIAPIGGDFNVAGGLYRYVELISTPETSHFDLGDMGGPGVYATTTSIAGGHATVNVRAKLQSDSTALAGYTVRTALLDATGRLVASAQQPALLMGGSSLEVDLALDIANPRLWQGVQDPYEYQLVAELLRAGTPIDKVMQAFGIRQMHFDPATGFFLNGKPVRLHGAGMHQDFLGKAWAISNQDTDVSLALFKEMGANAIRLAHYPHSPYTLRRVSALGLIAWAETSLGLGTTVERCASHQATDAFVANAKEQLQELIRQQYNHAAVAMWAVGNETTLLDAFCKDPTDNIKPVLRALHELAKKEDPSRATAYAEFAHGTDVPPPAVFDTQGITDVFATNRYFLWYTPEFELFGPLLDALHAHEPGQPLGISEYGAGAALSHHTDNPRGGLPEVRSAPEGEVSFQPEEYAAYVHEQNYRLISSKPYLWGSFIWNMIDFGSGHRNEGDVLGVNTKGLVTFDRQTRKDPFFFYKANWSDQPVVYITGRRYTDRAYPVTDVKVYSNADSVQLSVNGTPVGTMTAAQCEQRTCVFPDVPLSPGLNTVVAAGSRGGTAVSDTVAWTLTNSGINIAAGRLATGYLSSQGTRFGSDDFFVGGTGDFIELGEGPTGGGIPEDVDGTDDPLLYKNLRRGDFSYAIPLTNGSYQVTLGFLEPDRNARPGDRVFNVTANGQVPLGNFDILHEAGAVRTVITRTFAVNVSGSSLVINFNPIKGEALVSNIKVARQQLTRSQ